MAGDIRIGQGYDVHRFIEGRPLILGGVTIPHEYGLQGHSDADALLHSITDALLGAIADGDIGKHFPDTDPEWKGADSAKLLEAVHQRLAAAGWSIVNIDATVVTEAPKLAPYINPMRERIAAILHLSSDRVSLKATTSEKLGFIGKGEGLAAQSVVLITKSS